MRNLKYLLSMTNNEIAASYYFILIQIMIKNSHAYSDKFHCLCKLTSSSTEWIFDLLFHHQVQWCKLHFLSLNGKTCWKQSECLLLRQHSFLFQFRRLKPEKWSHESAASVELLASFFFFFFKRENFILYSILLKFDTMLSLYLHQWR